MELLFLGALLGIGLLLLRVGWEVRGSAARDPLGPRTALSFLFAMVGIVVFYVVYIVFLLVGVIPGF